MKMLASRLCSFAFCASLFAVPVLPALLPSGASAQVTGQGSVSGTVTDPSGAVIPGAKIDATNIATNVVVSRTATGSGYYVVSPLPPGEYVVTITANGFSALRQEHVNVNALEVTTLNPVLKVGATNETVEVTTAPPPLQTANATLGDVIENQTYSELPIALASGTPRDPTAFASLVNGVQSGGRSGSFDGTGGGNENEMYVEGVPMTTVDSQGDNRKLNQNLSIEAVEQTQVQTSGEGAQFQGIGVENFSIKQGTNKFHGNVSIFVRNTALDTWNYFAKAVMVPTANGTTVQQPKPPEHQNELSASLGGPLVHNHLFFFGNYDRYHYRSTTNPTLQTIPTLAARTGDFSAYPYPIYDPTTYTACTAANKGVPCAYQFNGLKNGVPTLNVIPQGELSSTMLKLAANLPQPSNNNLTSNYLSGRPVGNDIWEFTGRLDWTLSSKQQLAFISTNGVKKFPPCDYGATSVLPYPYTNCTNVTELTTTDIIKHTWELTPHLVNQVRYGYTRFWAPIGNLTTGDPTFSGSALGIGNLPAGQASSTAPGVTFSGGSDGPSSFSAPTGYHEAVNTYTIADDVTWQKGKHNFTFGGDFQFLEFNQSVADSFSKPITFTFKNTTTSGFSSAGVINTTNGLSFASYLLGAVDSTSVYTQNFSTLGARYKAFSPYAQDDWKVTPNLTVNLGLRWDLYTPYREVQNRWSALNPTMINPATGNAGALEYIGYGSGTCNCSTPVNTWFKNIGPRIGIAYQYTPRDVVRASYGINFTHNGGVGGSSGGNYNGTGQIGLTVSPAFVDSTQGEQPAFYLNPAMGNNSIPAYSTTINPTATANTGNYLANGVGVTASSVSYADPYLSGRPPYTESFTFGLQHSITNTLTISADYAGNQSHFLNAGLRGFYNNELPAQYQLLGSLLKQLPNSIDTATGPNKGKTFLAEAQAIIPGIAIPYATYGGSAATIGQMLKPFPQYSGVSDTWGDTGNANYNAFQLKLQQRPWHGLSYTLNYTYSKTIDDLAIRSRYPIPGSVIDGGVGTTRAYGLDRTASTTNIPNTLHIYGLYELPIGGRQQFGGSHFLVRAIAGGWSTSFIFTKISGAPLTISGASCQTPDSCFPSINTAFSGPVRINGSYGSGITAATASSVRYIDPTAFVPTPGNGGYNFGNSSRTAPYGLYNIGSYDLDLGLRRQFPIYDRVKLTIQADGFNMTNHVQFGGVGTTLSALVNGLVPASSTFGEVTKQSNGSRDFQIAAKVTF